MLNPRLDPEPQITGTFPALSIPMALDDLDISQISVVSIQDDTPSGSTQDTSPVPSPYNSLFPHSHDPPQTHTLATGSTGSTGTVATYECS
jgi:hypothetical protein